jgi:hypothetical protein
LAISAWWETPFFTEEERIKNVFKKNDADLISWMIALQQNV